MSSLFSDDFLESLAVVGFIIGVMNYEENLSQSDKDDIIQEFSRNAQELLSKLEQDLDKQNDMLREIIERLDRLEQRRPDQ